MAAARSHILILSAGGIRSLVATALMLARREKPRITTLYFNDGRNLADIRREFAQRQAEHFNLGKLHQLEFTQLFGTQPDRGQGNGAIGSLVVGQMLLAAVTYARANQAQTVIWPGCFDSEHNAVAKASEQLALCQHLVEVEDVPMPNIEATLLELSDQQVIELGGQLQVPWQLAWSCLTNPDKACGSCAACRRRKNAFEKAGIVDHLPERHSSALPH